MHPHEIATQHVRTEYRAGATCFAPALLRDVRLPAGTTHNVINASKTTPLKLYTSYSPPNHPDGTVHKTKSEAEAAEAAEHHR